jgi:hypothetical protein
MLNTTDGHYGKMRFPVVIRFPYDGSVDPEIVVSGSYEVNVLVPTGRFAANRDDIEWWTVNESEIECSLGMAVVERPSRWE